MLIWWMESTKEQHLFEMGNFCNIILVFTEPFDQLNASLLIKSVTPPPPHKRLNGNEFLCIIIFCNHSLINKSEKLTINYYIIKWIVKWLIIIIIKQYILIWININKSFIFYF